MGIIQFTRYPKEYRTKYQNILFRNKRKQSTDNQDKEQHKIKKKPNPINLEDLPEYI